MQLFINALESVPDPRAENVRHDLRQRNRIERFLNKLKNFRRIATRYDKLGANFFAFIQLASIRIFLRSIEPTA